MMQVVKRWKIIYRGANGIMEEFTYDENFYNNILRFIAGLNFKNSEQVTSITIELDKDLAFATKFNTYTQSE